MAVEPRLADKDLQPAPERLADALDLLPQGLEVLRGRRRRCLAHAGRRAVLAERLTQRRRPLAGRHADAGGGDRRGHDVLVAAGDPRELRERGVDPRLVSGSAPAGDRLALLGLDLGIDGEDAAVGALEQGRGLALREPVEADDDLLTGLDPAQALAVAVDQRGLHVVHGGDGSAMLLDHGHLRAGAAQQLGDEPVHHLRALEDVRVLEQVRLVRKDLLDAQRPLLIPRPGEPQGLVPGRQLDRSRARVAAECHRQGLEHDPLDVVLRLRLGQPERVDLHAVAEAQVLGVLDAVALAPELFPEHAHRAQLRVLLDEPHARVDEERDAREALAIVNAISCTGVAPASCRWYEQMLIGLNLGTRSTV